MVEGNICKLVVVVLIRGNQSKARNDSCYACHMYRDDNKGQHSRLISGFSFLNPPNVEEAAGCRLCAMLSVKVPVVVVLDGQN